MIILLLCDFWSDNFLWSIGNIMVYWASITRKVKITQQIKTGQIILTDLESRLSKGLDKLSTKGGIWLFLTLNLDILKTF